MKHPLLLHLLKMIYPPEEHEIMACLTKMDKVKFLFYQNSVNDYMICERYIWKENKSSVE